MLQISGRTRPRTPRSTRKRGKHPAGNPAAGGNPAEPRARGHASRIAYGPAGHAGPARQTRRSKADRMNAPGRWRVPLFLFLGVYFFSGLSHIATSFDSRWTVYIAMSIWNHRDTNLDEYPAAIRKTSSMRSNASTPKVMSARVRPKIATATGMTATPSAAPSSRLR